MKLIYDAIQNGDEETFIKLVDIDAMGHRRHDETIAFYEKRIAEGKEKKYYSPMMSPEQVSIVVIGQDMIDNNLKSLSLEMQKISADEWKIVWYDFDSFGFPDMGRDYN